MGIKFLTIYTDASMCQDTKIGGWACWIKQGPTSWMKLARPFRLPVVDSTDAEMKAILNALVVANKNFTIEPGTIYVVVTDSAIAIQHIQPKGVKSKKGRKKHRRRRRKSERYAKLADLINDTIPDDCELRVRKVKAHSHKDGKRSYINNLVDRLARQAMREKREIIITQRREENDKHNNWRHRDDRVAEIQAGPGRSEPTADHADGICPGGPGQQGAGTNGSIHQAGGLAAAGRGRL